MAVTLKDLARETGLSYATISAYVNGKKVRSYNNDKIEAAIKKLGYIPNDYARSLKMHSSKTIGVLVPDMDTKITTNIMAELQKELRKDGYGTIICDCRTDEALEQKMLRFLLSKMVDGIVILPVSDKPEALDIVVEKGIPVVVVNAMAQRKDVSHIVVENKEKYKEAIERMVQRGRKHIGLIYAGAKALTAKERVSAFNEVLQKYGLYEEKYIYKTEFTISGGCRAMKTLLARYPELDGVFISNYEMSIGAFVALRELNKKMPEDISFVGIDLEEDGDSFSVRPASVDRPVKEIGRKTARLMLRSIKEKTPSDDKVVCSFVPGETI